MNESIWKVLAKAADLVGILAFCSVSIAIPAFFPADQVAKLYAIFLCIVNALLLTYVAVISVRKRHRYADTIQHTHFVNHNVRDWLCRVRRLDAIYSVRPPDFGADFHANTAKVLDQIADAFTQVCGKRCAVCIKESRPNPQSVSDSLLVVMHRDSLSQQTRGVGDDSNPPHPISQDTPCHEIYSSKRHRSFYLCNNVITSRTAGRYDSPAFHRNPENLPVVSRFGPFHYPTYWPLEYASCLVLPIRCQIPSDNGGKPINAYWGFLCIDCRSRNVFDNDTAWLLAATFADVLYVYFSQTFDKIEHRA